MRFLRIQIVLQIRIDQLDKLQRYTCTVGQMILNRLLEFVTKHEIIRVNGLLETSLDLHTPTLPLAVTGAEVRCVFAMLDAVRVGTGKVLDTDSDATLEEGSVDLDGVVIVVDGDGLEGVHRGAGGDLE